MPELPEVETMRTSLLPYCNRVINKVVINNPNLRKKVNDNFIADISNNYITNIERLGKFLLFSLSNQKYLLMHAGMSGKFIIENLVKDTFAKNYSNLQLSSSTNNTLYKHNHIILTLEDGTNISFNDPRRFGLALTFNSRALATQNLKLGIDALSSELTIQYLTKLLQKSTSDIKTFLLNQQAIAGIGNIYASEILFYSKIHPLTVSKTLSASQIKLLLKYIKEVLTKAVKLGGSTLKDYQKPNGEIGYFQTTFAVYNKDMQKCSSCGNLITKITQKGRSTYLCPKEQIL